MSSKLQTLRADRSGMYRISFWKLQPCAASPRMVVGILVFCTSELWALEVMHSGAVEYTLRPRFWIDGFRLTSSPVWLTRPLDCQCN